MCRLLSSVCELLLDEQGVRTPAAGATRESHSIWIARAWFKDEIICPSQLSFVYVSLESGTLSWPCLAAATLIVPGNQAEAFGKQVVPTGPQMISGQEYKYIYMWAGMAVWLCWGWCPLELQSILHLFSLPSGSCWVFLSVYFITGFSWQDTFLWALSLLQSWHTQNQKEHHQGSLMSQHR